MRKMKDSGVEWIGEIPEGWNVTPIKAIASCYGRIGFRGYTTEDLVDDGEGAITLSPTNIVDSHIDLSKCSYLSWEKYYESPEIMIFRGDIIFVKTASVGKCAIYESDEVATINPQFVVFKGVKCNYKFLFYNLISDVIQNQLSLNNMGGVIGTITQKALLGYKIALPDNIVQQKIVDYLDEKCSRIDAIIARQEEIIERLKEYKLSIIIEAVTKGLNPEVKMRSSGNEWIGDIPGTSVLTRAGHIFDIILGKMLSPKPNDETDTLEEYFCAGNVHFEGVDDSDLKKMWFSSKEKEQYLVKCGDLLVVEGGAGAGGASIVTYCDRPIFVQNSILIVRGENLVQNKWLYYTLFSLVKRNYIDFVCNKATIPHFTKDKLSNVPVVVFSTDETQRIVEYLDSKCSSIDNTISIRLSAIEKLRDYKKSLIYEVVTGKKEV